MLKELKRDNDFKVYSRALTYEEIGSDIYPPMKRELIKNDIPFERHYAEIISKEDYEEADYIFYMDEENKWLINRLLKDYKNIARPVFVYTPSIREIEDPWYTGRFNKVVEQLKICIEDILKNI